MAFWVGRFFPQPLRVGSTVPDVLLQDPSGHTQNLRACIPLEGWTLLYFFPKAFTFGCTAQACHLKDRFSQLAQARITILGVSTDPPHRLRAFAQRWDLPFRLLSDSQRQAARAFGVPVVLGLALRQAFLFRGHILAWRDLHPRPTRLAEDILCALQNYPSLGGSS
ncbi:peroxiredoxin [Candidatus Methylacidithermus pantelleriae]|uniref:thioredoxin-dependent peroxiredoxin n=1 Tax=Candidatus Methylacidithermus pantelleriae TaxID=2744239 RepID=A0A8J2BLS9_9BACT|nr:redoxin domain-containing protein [Candidatus Methylacidithermus pantelleriae]CAF0703870.1 Peroxiredoxin [Candidatus Methylacidithermus pantelleriae]